MGMNCPDSGKLVAPVSVTHVHLLGCLNTEIRSLRKQHFRIIDIGCGNGELMKYLHLNLAALNPDVRFDFFGFDVQDYGIQQEDFFSGTKKLLAEHCPGVDWNERLQLLSLGDKWPYPDGSFDIAVTNQVMEHIDDFSFFLGELRRVLNPDGVSINLFPLKHYILEGHTSIPFAHRIGNDRFLKRYIKACYRLGLGNLKRYGKNSTPDEYARHDVAYIREHTNYLSFGELNRTFNGNGFSASYGSTVYFYAQKLLSLMKSGPILSYRRFPGLISFLFLHVFKYAQCVTVRLIKRPRF